MVLGQQGHFHGVYQIITCEPKKGVRSSSLVKKTQSSLFQYIHKREQFGLDAGHGRSNQCREIPNKEVKTHPNHFRQRTWICFTISSTRQDNPDYDDIVISTMHANQPNPLPSKDNATIIHSIKNIVQATGQVSQVMNFPPIDHDSPIW